MELVARQFIRAVRGKRSQEAFSRRLGYTSNPVADWEAGRRFPTAAETLRACRLAGIDVHGAFAQFSEAEAESLSDMTDEAVAAWLTALRGNTSIKEVAEKIDASRYAVARWLAGATRPRLPDFLRVIDGLTGRLSDLLAELVDIERIPAMVETHRQRHASRRVAFDEPWVAAVICLLETAGYRDSRRHEEGWVARQLGIPLEVEQRCLARLEDAGFVVREPGGTFAIRDELTIDTYNNPEGTRRLKAHWAELGLHRATAPREGDLVSYNVFAVSKDDLERIREAHIRYFMEVRTIVSESEPEVAALVNIQLLHFQ